MYAPSAIYHVFFIIRSAFASSSPPTEGLFSCFCQRGTEEARLDTTAHVRAPAERRGAYSGRPELRYLARVVVWVTPRRAAQDYGNPHISKSLKKAAAVQALPFVKTHGTAEAARRTLPSRDTL